VVVAVGTLALLRLAFAFLGLLGPEGLLGNGREITFLALGEGVFVQVEGALLIMLVIGSVVSYSDYISH
jgi:hypothetical protein